MTDVARPAVLAARGLHKSFPGVVALHDAALELRAGEIHAVMGENGSGKSTLVSCLSGSLRPASGVIRIDGQDHGHLDPRQAVALGIAVVHQEPQLSSAMTVAENVLMGQWPVKRGVVQWRALHRRAQEVLDELGIRVDARVKAGTLPVGRRQVVEIAKALHARPRVLLLDEATSSLAEDDVDALFGTLRRLRDRGVAIALITHRMAEVMSLADRATVLRDGCLVGTVHVADVDEHRLVSMMVGRDLSTYWHKRDVAIGSPLLEVRGLQRGPLRDVDLTVRHGEIVGLAGLVGSGRSAVIRTLAGLRKPTAGSLLVDGAVVTLTSPRRAQQHGIACVPEDRKTAGLILDWSIRRNASLSVMNDRGPLSRITKRFDLDALRRGSAGLHIAATGPEQLARQLSGGNQQKVVLAKNLAATPRLLLLDEPTRGVDVGAKEDIYAAMADLVEQGMGLLVVSSELPELLGVCDRIYVMYQGRVVAEFPRADATEEAITYAASGGRTFVQEGLAS